MRNRPVEGMDRDETRSLIYRVGGGRVNIFGATSIRREDTKRRSDRERERESGRVGEV